MECLNLANGNSIPIMGMGTFPLVGKKMIDAVKSALECGYRAFDTAYGYNNDDSLGDALKKALPSLGLKREDVFITSKIGDRLNHGVPTGSYFYHSASCIDSDVQRVVNKQLDSALKNLNTDYVDLMLIHYPYPQIHQAIWACLERAYQDGKVKAIGVSNYRERHLKELFVHCEVKPMVNQYEHHPLNTKKELLRFCKSENIIVEAYSPLLVMNPKLINSHILIGLAEKYQKTIPQIILRWNIQLGIIPIPKSGNATRLRENLSIFDFELSYSEMCDIDGLNINYKALPESLYCPGY